jgi:YebC/PmpR family DNA-binding regulatory protein
MSGHSKWANIKNKKEKTDSQKGKIFTKIGREIAVAVKSGGADPEANSKLRDIVAKAKAANIPNDNILRSIKKAAGDEGTTNYEEIMYEGYGPGGIAIIVETMTDNRNRTASEMRHIFDKYGGNLGSTGCVSWMFDKKGLIVIEKSSKFNEDDLMMMSLDAGAQDFVSEDEYYEITTNTDDFSAVREALENRGIEFTEAELKMIPQNKAEISDDDLVKLEKLIEMLEDNDDVQNVYTNMD